MGLRLHGFNPRTREGCDGVSKAEFARMCGFQSTHPRGVRLGRLVLFPVFGVSIHAPARGATFREYNLRARVVLFQSTHPRGVRPALAGVMANSGVFQSTHPRGVRLCMDGENLNNSVVSIHAPARGATISLTMLWLKHGFQSTHPRGVRPAHHHG